MCVCSFDMGFTCIMAGREGTTNNIRILLEYAMKLDNRIPMPPQGKCTINFASCLLLFYEKYLNMKTNLNCY